MELLQGRAAALDRRLSRRSQHPQGLHGAGAVLGHLDPASCARRLGRRDRIQGVVLALGSSAGWIRPGYLEHGDIDQGGKGIIQASLDAGAFYKFVMADGMVGESLIKAIGKTLNGSVATAPGSNSSNAKMFIEVAKKNDITGDSPFAGEGYDAAALIILAAQAAGSKDRAAIRAKILEVSNAPGEKIGPAELARGLKLLADGKAIGYQGATDVDLTAAGDASSPYKE